MRDLIVAPCVYMNKRDAKMRASAMLNNSPLRNGV